MFESTLYLIAKFNYKLQLWSTKLVTKDILVSKAFRSAGQSGHDRRSQIVGRESISERPANIEAVSQIG